MKTTLSILLALTVCMDSVWSFCNQLDNTIGRAMLECQGSPSTCECNGVETKFEDVLKSKCIPKSCLCSGGDVKVQLETQSQSLVSNTLKFLEELSESCNGGEPTSCDCKNGGDSLTFPVRNPINVAICGPENCTCADGSTFKYGYNDKSFSYTQSFLQAQCNNEDPETCTCLSTSDPEGNSGKVARPPFTSESFWACRPSKCFCKRGKEVIVPSLSAENEKKVMENLRKLVETALDTVNTICSGEQPATCPCSNGDGNMDWNDFLQWKKCQPSICTCPNGSEVKVPSADTIFSGADNFLSLLNEGKIKELLSGVIGDIDGVVELLTALSEEAETYVDIMKSACDGELPSSVQCTDGNKITALALTELFSCYPSALSCPSGNQINLGNFDF